MLSLGADCAVAKECVLNNLVPTNALVMGNMHQLNALVKKLKLQAFNLPAVGKKLEAEIRDLNDDRH